MNKLILDSEFHLITDDHQWTLVREIPKVKEKDNSPYMSVTKTYHGRLEHALKWYISNSLKSCKSVIELSEKLDTLYTKLKDIEIIKDTL